MLLVDDILVSALVFHHDQSITFGVQSEHGNVNLAVEDNVVFQVSDRGLLRLDARGIVQRLKIGIQTKAGLLVERLNLRMIWPSKIMLCSRYATEDCFALMRAELFSA